VNLWIKQILIKYERIIQIIKIQLKFLIFRIFHLKNNIKIIIFIFL